ncbi:MAG: hypothetical protein AAB316_07035, partial [Bacteroidota bacterium]
KEPDCLRKIRRKGSKKWQILQVEFEAKDERRTDKRMAFYAALIDMLTGLEVEQHLIYLLDGKPKRFTGSLQRSNYSCQFKIHCISEWSSRELINSDKPEEVVLGVLANPEGRSGEEIIHLILERLAQLRGDSAELMKFIQQLKIFSMLRNLRRETLKQANKMSFTIPREIIEADDLFIEGMEKGIEKGMEKGMEKGQTVKDIIAIRNMLAKKFDLPTISDILEVTQDYVLEIKTQLEKELEIVALLKKGTRIPSIAKALEVSRLVVEVLKKEHGN